MLSKALIKDAIAVNCITAAFMHIYCTCRLLLAVLLLHACFCNCAAASCAGCTHFIVGRDMAGSKSSLTGEDFYGMYDAQELATKHAPELGMQTVPSLDVVYTEEVGYVTALEAKERGLHIKKLSGTKFRQMLRSGEEIPEWFAFKSVVEVLRDHAQHNSSSNSSSPRAAP